jgi:hypothetical protein
VAVHVRHSKKGELIVPTWNAATNQVTNPYFSLMLEPLHGGRIVSLQLPAGELTTRAAAADLLRPQVPYKFGLLAVQLWQDSCWHNDLCHRAWSLGNLTITPTQVAVTVKGDSVLWAGVGVSRTFVFTDDPWIDAHHELNPGSTTGPYEPPAFWFSNVMSGRGRTYVPGPAGVLDYPRWQQDQSWCYEPTDGWIAWVGPQGGSLS